MTRRSGMIRPTVRNRFVNELVRTPVANQRRRAGAAFKNPIYPLRPHAANRSPLPARPVRRRRRFSKRRRCGWGEATVRAARGEREKRLGSVPSAAALTRHRRTPQLVIDPIIHSCADHFSRRRYRQHARGRAVFPRRRTGAKAQPCRRRWSAYVESPGEPRLQRSRKQAGTTDAGSTAAMRTRERLCSDP